MPTNKPKKRQRPPLKMCKWFALCTKNATTTRPHPILGDVPICTRCNDKLNEIEKR